MLGGRSSARHGYVHVDSDSDRLSVLYMGRVSSFQCDGVSLSSHE